MQSPKALEVNSNPKTIVAVYEDEIVIRTSDDKNHAFTRSDIVGMLKALNAKSTKEAIAAARQDSSS